MPNINIHANVLFIHVCTVNEVRTLYKDHIQVLNVIQKYIKGSTFVVHFFARTDVAVVMVVHDL